MLRHDERRSHPPIIKLLAPSRGISMNFNEPLFTYLHVFTVFIPWTVKKIYSQCLRSSCEMRL